LKDKEGLFYANQLESVAAADDTEIPQIEPVVQNKRTKGLAQKLEKATKEITGD
jgi:hypothetical protein